MDTPDKNKIEKNEKTDIFSPFDEYVGKFIASLNSWKHPHVGLAASLISRNLWKGHVCLNLREFAGKSILSFDQQESLITCPDLSAWINSLMEDDNVGSPGEFKALILDGMDRLYFHRYWSYENDIACFIRQKMKPMPAPAPEMDRGDIPAKLHHYFPESSGTEICWPAVAAISAWLRKFFVITGSPGTGKTTTVTRILAFLQDCSQTNLRIALCAPTGKAAQRLKESVRKTKMNADWPEAVKNAIPDEATTLHRLLGSIRFSPYFQYDENNPLPYNIVVVDESSMVDLPLMAKLMTALSDNSRLILLGDKDQLASVEAGAVLGSICFPDPLNDFSQSFGKRISEIYEKDLEMKNPIEGVHDCIVELRKNYRFHEESGLNIISKAVRNGDVLQVESHMRTRKLSGIHFHHLQRTKKAISDLIEDILESYQPYINEVVSENHCVEEVFAAFEKFRILCALRTGLWGVSRINRLLEKKLSENRFMTANSGYYAGKPVMVTKNDYSLNLFNGDIGIVLKDKSDENKLKVFFRQETDELRKIAPERLPAHETAWAMTVHKSQGSEFDGIALILSDIDNPILTRELLYTGITRARCGAEIWSDENILLKTVKKQIVRHSGLTDALK